MVHTQERIVRELNWDMRLAWEYTAALSYNLRRDWSWGNEKQFEMSEWTSGVVRPDFCGTYVSDIRISGGHPDVWRKTSQNASPFLIAPQLQLWYWLLIATVSVGATPGGAYNPGSAAQPCHGAKPTEKDATQNCLRIQGWSTQAFCSDCRYYPYGGYPDGD